MTDSASPTPLPRGISPLERRVLAIGTAIVLHAVVLATAAIVQALVATAGQVPALPHQPLLLSAVALLFAHCSLGAVWWARSRWPSYAKTLVAVLASAAIWALLLAVLESTKLEETSAAGWAASLATQTLAAALGAAVLELIQQPQLAAGNSRFTIMFLLLWTAVVGVLLGAGRSLAEAAGWKLADVLQWEWFYQLQVLAVANAALAVSLLAAIRLRRDWSVRLLAAGFALFFVALAAPGVLTILFTRVGATFADVVWLLLIEGLFLLATLVPMEAGK